MSSQKQIEANRRNAEKSTGPKSKEGKMASSKNSIKHGLLASETILPWENGEELKELMEKLKSTLHPEGELESILVDRIISITWRLRRAGRIETGIYAWQRYSLNYDPKQVRGTKTDAESLSHEAHIEAMGAINSYPDLPELGLIFSENTIAFSNLHRYESGLEKSLYRALHELQRLQIVRKGGEVPAPIAVHINGAES